MTLAVTIEELTREEWANLGRRIYRDADGLTWQLADWAALGERKWGALKEFCELNDINYQTLRTYSSVAAKVEVSRRLDKLSFSHHQEVSPLPPKEQTKWLNKALESDWPVSVLRKNIREALGDNDALLSDGPQMRTIGNKWDDVGGFLVGRPVEYWNEETERIWRERFRPVLPIIRKLFPE